MTDYGFKKATIVQATSDRLDLTNITRELLPVDPILEDEAIRRGGALGFVDREERVDYHSQVSTSKRRRKSVPQASLFIKGPKDVLDWFVVYTNQNDHRSYWQTIEEFRSMIESKRDVQKA